MEMTVRKNDLAVFEFMLRLVKCKGPAFTQVAKYPMMRLCETPQGSVLDFADKQTMAEVERLMTPTARRAVSEVLERVEAMQAKDAAASLQKTARKSIVDDDDTDSDADAAEAFGGLQAAAPSNMMG